MSIVKSICVLLVVISGSAAGQQYQRFHSSACLNETRKQIPPGCVLVGVIALNNFDTTVGSTALSVNDGKSTAWVYAFYDSAKDSVILGAAAYFSYSDVFNECVPYTQSYPLGTISMDRVNQNALPSPYLEGYGLIESLMEDEVFIRYISTFPDVDPDTAVLTVLNEAVLDYPAGTALWTLVWNSPTESNPMLACHIDAITGRTFCYGAITDVDILTPDGDFCITPNPASRHARITVPSSWIGTHLTIDAVDGTGNVKPLMRESVCTSTFFDLNIEELSSGMYTLCMSTDREFTALRLSVVH